MNIVNATQTLLEIKKVLNKLRVKFWLVDGAALGAVRNKAFIPYDLDIDLRVMASDCNLPGLIKAFTVAGFNVHTSMNCPALYKDLPSGIVLRKRGIKIDICLGYYYPPEDVIVVLAGRPAKDISVLPAKLFKGSHYVDFVGAKFRIPYPSAEYFTLVFGSKWNIPVNKKYSHPQISIAKYVDYFHKHPEGNSK